jgi:hypothetical protein
VVSKSKRIRERRRAGRAIGEGTPQAAVLDSFDWWAFTCSACGEQTAIGRDPAQPIDQFSAMCEWILGDPPVCTTCQLERAA